MTEADRQRIRLERERTILADASDVLFSSLDYDATLASVTRLAAERIADWCAIDEVLPSGELRRIAVAHRDPAKVELALRITERYPPDPEAPHGAHHVIRTGEAELVGDIPDELLVSAAQDAEHLEILRSLGLRSYIAVPLTARGATLGALTLVIAENDTRFDEQDLELARELARRAAIAIDNARLYRDSEEARLRLEETAVELEAQAAELQHQAWQLEESQAELEVTNEELAEHATEAAAAREEAESARALLDAFFRAAPVAAAYLDSDLRYRRVNPAMAEIDGMDAEAMIGKHLRDVVPSLAPALEPLYRQVLDTGEPITNLAISAAKATDPGVMGHYIVNYFPIQLDGRSPLGVGLVALDVTELRQAQERENIFARVLEESRSEIYLFDAETLRFQQVNRGARENLGYSLDEMRALTPLDIKPDFTADRFTELVAPLRSGETEMVLFETVHQRRDGSTYPVDVRLQLFAGGERPLFVALILDSTERLRVERELVAARETAEQASDAKTQFLTVMSHELRTPLNAIIGFQDLLEAEVGGPLTGDQRQHLSRIRAGAQQLLGLIDQILSLARIESGKEEVVREESDLRALAEEAISLMAALARRKGLELRPSFPEGPIPMLTDAGKVRQILMNLLGNAVKFTDSGEVELAVIPGDERVLVRVRDTGPGIPEALRDGVFEPFVQGDPSQTRRHGGTGLGLAVSRELARLLGGDVDYEPAEGGGSVFTLALPA